MILRISDLLDGYQEAGLVAEETTPLSMKRVEEMTMQKVAPPPKRRIRRFLPKVLAAAVLTSLLAVTAIAGEREWQVSDWFRPAVDQKIQEEVQTAQRHWPEVNLRGTVEESQLKAIDAHGKLVNQSVTKNGATVTLAAMYGDEYVLNLYFQVEAPEGVVLPDGEKYGFTRDWHQISSQDSPVVWLPAGYESFGHYHPRPEAMPDDDPTDNKKDFVLTLTHGQKDKWGDGKQKQWTFSDGVAKSCTLMGLYRSTGYKKVDYRYENTYEEFFFGPFTFDITNAHQVPRKEINVTGCDYSGHVQNGKHPETGEYAIDFTYTISPVRLALSPFTAEVETRYSGSQNSAYSLLDFEIVMKDGSRAGQDGYVSSETGEDWGRHAIRFTAPIDLEQIDYVLIGNLEHGDTMHKVYP